MGIATDAMGGNNAPEVPVEGFTWGSLCQILGLRMALQADLVGDEGLLFHR